MKKVFALACTFALVAGFVSCGPSEEERKADSAEVASTAKNMESEADSMIAQMNRMNDSTDAANRAADSLKKDSAKK
jgi:hypothetical protein